MNLQRREPRMSAAEKITEEYLPSHLAREALEGTDGSRLEATAWALDWLRKHRAWADMHWEAMATAWLDKTIGREISDVRRSSVRQSHKTGGGDVVPFQSQLTAAIADNYSRMMDAPLWGGKRIGDATPYEIRESAEQFARNGKSLARKAYWQIAVAEHAEKNGIGPDERVRDSLSEATLARLWEEANAEQD